MKNDNEAGRSPVPEKLDRNAALVRLMADDGVNLEYCRELAKAEMEPSKEDDSFNWFTQEELAVKVSMMPDARWASVPKICCRKSKPCPTHKFRAADPAPPQGQTPRCPECLSDSRKHGNMRPCRDAWHTEAEPAPMTRPVRDDMAYERAKYGWMDSIHFDDHLENDSKPQKIYRTAESCKEGNRCIDTDGHCKALRVRITLAEPESDHILKSCLLCGHIGDKALWDRSGNYVCMECRRKVREHDAAAVTREAVPPPADEPTCSACGHTEPLCPCERFKGEA